MKQISDKLLTFQRYMNQFLDNIPKLISIKLLSKIGTEYVENRQDLFVRTEIIKRTFGELPKLVNSKNSLKIRALSISLISLSFLANLATASAFTKRPTFQLPLQEQLTEGAGPLEPVQTKQKIGGSADLSPLGLSSEESQNSDKQDSDGLLKSGVVKSEFRAKDKAGTSSANAVASGKKESIKKGLAEKVISKDKKVDVAPLALLETDQEAEKKAETTVSAEKAQLSELWQSTIDRNPDIQFVINKLQPSSDQNHAMATTMKFLSATLFGAMNMAPFMIPGGAAGSNPMAMMGMGSGASLIQGLFQSGAEKQAKKQAISQEQATILYKITREVADKLVSAYRNYKKEMTAVERASADLKDLQTMVAEVRGSQDAAKQVEMEYTLRKAKRDIQEKEEQVYHHRQELTDLAGVEAIAKLDSNFKAEREAIENITGDTNIASDNKGQADELNQNLENKPFVNPLINRETAAKGSTKGTNM